MPKSSDTVVASRNGKPFAEVSLKHELTIGRRAGADLQLEDPGVTRDHARIVQSDSRWFLLDNRSTNGTYLNGAKLNPGEPVELSDGARAAIADFELAFHFRDAGATAIPGTRQIALPTPELEAPPPSSPVMKHLVDGRNALPVWSEGVARLRVVDIVQETSDSKTFRLAGEQPLLFSFEPGQFITLSLDIDGQNVKRSYSISSSPSRPHVIELTIKRVPGGLVSNYMNDRVKLGDTLSVRGPSGKFSCFTYPSRKILGIAGGSGITPIMSMARWIVDTAADVDFTLLCSAKSPQDIIFRKELEWMTSRHSGFRVVITVTNGWHGVESWTGFTGRCDSRLLHFAAPDLLERHVFLCGPGPFMGAVKDALKDLNFPLAHLHSESFGEGRVAAGEQAPRPVVVPVAAAPAAAPRASTSAAAPAPTAPPPKVKSGFAVVFAKSSKESEAAGDACILDIAEQCGVELNYGCRSGSCGACRVKCAGEVSMSEDSGLRPGDREKGFVLACVAVPKSDVRIEA